MKCSIIALLCILSVAFALPLNHGMVFYRMPYYNPYHQAMLVHYSQPYGRSVGTSAFTAGDAIAAGTLVRENRVPSDASHISTQQSLNEGTVEAIAEAYPEEPIQGSVQYDQDDRQYNEVLPLNAAPLSGESATANLKPLTENISTEVTAIVSEEPQSTTVAPKKKVHIALDLPDTSNSHEDRNDEVDEDYPFAPQKPAKPSKNGGSPVYTFFPVSFGRAAGGTIAIANAYSTGKGAVRSHAIAYGTSDAPRRQSAAVN